jgi:hypothetical protein
MAEGASVAIGSLALRWNMSRDEVRAAVRFQIWGENEHALGFCAMIDWGDAEIREIMGATYLILFFDERGLAKIQFPSGAVLGDDGTARYFLGRAREHLGAAHGPPACGSVDALHLEWTTPGTTISVRIDAELDGPRERGTFGFHMHYTAEHYTAPRDPDRYLRVTYARATESAETRPG